MNVKDWPKAPISLSRSMILWKTNKEKLKDQLIRDGTVVGDDSFSDRLELGGSFEDMTIPFPWE